MARGFILLGLASALLSPVAAADGGHEGLAPSVGQLYRDAVQVLSGDPADGAQGLVRAVLYPSVDGPAMWQLQRGLEGQAASGRVVHEVAGHAPPAIPAQSAAGLPFVVVGATRASAAGGTLSELAGPAEDAGGLPGDAGAAAEAALEALPVDPRGAVEDLAEQLGTVSIRTLLGAPPATADPRAAEPVAPRGVVDGLGVRAPAAAAASAPATREALRATLAPDSLASPLRSPEAPPQPAPARAHGGSGAFLVEAPLPVAAMALALILLLPPLYHRLARSAVLDHAIRARLFSVVQERAGIHIEELARAAGCSRSTAVYHLHLLARHGHVVARPGPKSVHYYPNNGKFAEAESAQRALLASRRKRQLAACIAAHPGIGRGELASAAGIAASTLTWHMAPLLELGLVEERRDPSGARGLFASPSLPALLRPWTEAARPAGGAAPAAPPEGPMTFA